MAELKLGSKFECFRCSTKFYDLGKSEPVCPKCGADQREAAKGESGAATQSARKKRKAEVVRAVEEEETVEVEQLDEAELPEAELDAVIEADDEEEEADEEE
jgi:hypothetical protein